MLPETDPIIPIGLDDTATAETNHTPDPPEPGPEFVPNPYDADVPDLAGRLLISITPAGDAHWFVAVTFPDDGYPPALGLTWQADLTGSTPASAEGVSGAQLAEYRTRTLTHVVSRADVPAAPLTYRGLGWQGIDRTTPVLRCTGVACAVPVAPAGISHTTVTDDGATVPASYPLSGQDVASHLAALPPPPRPLV